MMMVRDHALKVYKITQSIAHWKTYKDLRNLVNTAVRREKRAYFGTKLGNRNKSNSLWAAVKDLGITKRKVLNLPENLSNVDDINEYFVNSVPVIEPDKELIQFYSNDLLHLCHEQKSSFKSQKVTEYEVLKTISSIKSTATGNDGISILTIHLCMPYILPFVKFRTETHNVNLRSKHQLTLPIHYTEQFKRSFSYNIVKFYNNLPNDLRSITSKSACKAKFTQVLMSQQSN
nr:unnamed protein product [Callosobruchus analis]